MQKKQSLGYLTLYTQRVYTGKYLAGTPLLLLCLSVYLFHPRMRRVIMFCRICLCVSLQCFITFESLNLESSFLTCGYMLSFEDRLPTSRIYRRAFYPCDHDLDPMTLIYGPDLKIPNIFRSGPYIKVIASRSWSPE